MVHPTKQRPVKIVAVVLIPSTQIIFKVTRESWAMNKSTLTHLMEWCIRVYNVIQVSTCCAHQWEKAENIRRNSLKSRRFSLWSLSEDWVSQRGPRTPAGKDESSPSGKICPTPSNEFQNELHILSFPPKIMFWRKAGVFRYWCWPGSGVFWLQ